MAFSTGKDSLFDEVRFKVSDADLVYYYLGVTEVPCLINSPLRQDNNPSFGLFSRDGTRIYWVDFATRERGGIIDLLALMWNYDNTKTLLKIKKDLPNFKNGATIGIHSHCSVRVNTPEHIDLQCKVREWRKYDIDYWASYGVPLEWLKYAEVYPISHKIVISNGQRYVFGTDKFAYAFIERKEGKITLKIYQPFNKNGYKWANKHDRSVISLWTKIPETGDKLCICSSLKDALCLWANTGIPAIAIQGEGYGMSETAISELKRRYKEVYILLDNDETGLADGEKLAKETRFTNLVLPQFKEGKDISDLYKSVGREKFLETINRLFKTKADEESDIFELPF